MPKSPKSTTLRDEKPKLETGQQCKEATLSAFLELCWLQDAPVSSGFGCATEDKGTKTGKKNSDHRKGQKCSDMFEGTINSLFSDCFGAGGI